MSMLFGFQSLAQRKSPMPMGPQPMTTMFVSGVILLWRTAYIPLATGSMSAPSS